MTRYVYRDGQFVNRKTGEPMLSDEERRRPIQMPQIMSDIPDYESPVTGEMITSRSHRREDLKRNDCFEMDPPKKPRGYKNPDFCKKHGLKLNPEIAEA